MVVKSASIENLTAGVKSWGVEGNAQSGYKSWSNTITLNSSQGCLNESGFFLAIYLYLLGQISQQSDFSILASANTVEESNELTGKLIDILPNQHQTWHTWVQKVQKCVVDATAFNCANFINLENAESDDRLLPVLLYGDPIALDGWEASLIKKHVIVFSVELPEKNKVKLRLSLFNGNLAQYQFSQICDSLTHLITTIPEKLSDPVSKHDVFNDVMFHRLIGFNEANKFSLDNFPNLPQALYDSAQKYPDKTAITNGEQSLSFKQLAEKVACFSSVLAGKGLTKGDKVAVFMSRDIDWAVCQIAIMSSGIVYVPIETSYPLVRVTNMLQHSRCTALVYDSEMSNKLRYFCNSHQINHFLYVNQHQNNQAINLVDLGKQLDKFSDAYIQFTSGTTGQPKGALIHHCGMNNHISAKINDLGIIAEDVIGQSASQCFDVSIWQILLGCFTGSKTVIYRQETIWDLIEFAEITRVQQITILELVPSYLESILEDVEAHSPKVFNNLKLLISTGERLTIGLVKRWFANYPKVDIVNAYGPTEASDDITHFRLGADWHSEKIPIGYPIQNIHIYLLDEEKFPVPMGSQGEIYVSGVCVGSGYVNVNLASTDVFFDDPFRKGHRMYKTGDFGCWLEDGSLLFYGRHDEQIKLNGVRIEILEIENQISLISEIKDVAVIQDKNRLTCFYTKSTDDLLSSGDIKKQLQKKLPAMCVPSKFVEINSMPLNQNGKQDKKLLKQMVL